MYYSDEEIEILREGGKKLAWIMKELGKFLKIGIKVHAIEEEAIRLIREVGAEPATVGYIPKGAKFPFPSAVCTSINDGIAHGISLNNERILQNGDIVSLDIVIKYKGLFVDICRTYGIGEISQKDRELIAASREVTNQAIEKAVVGNTTEDIGRVAEETAQQFGFDTIKELGGHGVGRSIHSEPFIPSAPNLGVEKVEIKEGMVLAIEPIVTAGDWRMRDGDDGYLYITEDGSKTSQFEDTILVTSDGVEILTKL